MAEAPGGESDGSDIGRGERVAHGRPEARVAVMDEDPDVSQASVLGIGGVPHELGDPRPVGLGADARDLTAAAGQVNQAQHGEAGQAAWRPDLDSEEVGGGEHVHSSGLVFRRPQAASHRRAVVYFCSAVLTFDF